jgi:hypothetical protein
LSTNALRLVIVFLDYADFGSFFTFMIMAPIICSCAIQVLLARAPGNEVTHHIARAALEVSLV